MTQTQASVRLLLEPVIVEPALPPWLPRGVGVTLVASRICVRISHLAGPKPRRIMLSGLQVTMHDVYEYSHGDTLAVDLPDSASCVETPPISLTFPLAGLYWIQATVSVEEPPVTVECFQRLLGQDAEGTGWGRGEPTNRWRAPIAVADLLSVQQTNLSARVERLTWIMTIMTLLTGLLSLDMLGRLVGRVILLGWPASKWLNVIGLVISAAAGVCLAIGSFQTYSTVHVAKQGEPRIEGEPESLWKMRRRQAWFMRIGYTCLAAGLLLQVVAQFVG